jgi:rod shape-determining protein MreD
MRALISFVAAAVAVVCQLTIVDKIAFPGGAGPDLVLVLVAALALASGPLVGALIGFWAGLALDVAPPGSHFTGQNALVFCLIGYVCGLLADEPSGDGVAEQGHTALFEIVVVAVGAVCGEALAALLGVMLSDPRVTWPAITHVLPVAAAYDAVACPFVLFAAAAALRLAGTRDESRRPASARIARTALPGAGPGAARPIGAGSTPRLRLSAGKGEGWIAGPRGQGAPGRPAPKREPRLKLGRGVPAGGLGATFATGGSLRGTSLRGSALRTSSLRASARTRMGRSLLGRAVFSPT